MKYTPAYLKDYSLLTYREAVTSKEGENWEKAINSDKKSLEINNTWEILKERQKITKYLQINGYFV